MASDHESETTGVDVMQDLGLFIDLCFFFFFWLFGVNTFVLELSTRCLGRSYSARYI